MRGAHGYTQATPRKHSPPAPPPAGPPSRRVCGISRSTPTPRRTAERMGAACCASGRHHASGLGLRPSKTKIRGSCVLLACEAIGSAITETQARLRHHEGSISKRLEPQRLLGFTSSHSASLACCVWRAAFTIFETIFEGLPMRFAHFHLCG